MPGELWKSISPANRLVSLGERGQSRSCPFPAAEDVISREEILALIAERAACPEAFTNGCVQLSANKLGLPKLVCLDTKDWIALARPHNGKASQHAAGPIPDVSGSPSGVYCGQ